jgi:integrase
MGKILAGSRPHVTDLWAVMWETGARPGEVYGMEARYYHPSDGCVVYPGRPTNGDFVWKNARKTGKDRVIYLTERAAEIVSRLAAKHPKGPLFRGRQRTAWGERTAARALQKIRQKAGIDAPITPYCFRHTYATDFLLRGGSIKVLADLLGTSVTMLERHYAHLEIDRPRMRAIALSVMAGR